MNRQQSLIIFGSVLGIAAIAVAIDHTRHPLPEPVAGKQQSQAQGSGGQEGGSTDVADNPCSLGEAPCSFGEAPCSLSENPCSLE